MKIGDEYVSKDDPKKVVKIVRIGEHGFSYREIDSDTPVGCCSLNGGGIKFHVEFHKKN